MGPSKKVLTPVKHMIAAHRVMFYYSKESVGRLLVLLHRAEKASTVCLCPVKVGKQAPI